MQGRQIYAIFCLFVMTTQWMETIGASFVTEQPSSISTGEKDLDRNDINSFLNSYEIISEDDYDDDLDIDLGMQKQRHQNDKEWDVLIFTQQWPVTTCYHWREGDKTHSCSLPETKEFWTIHGIWPTKLGHIGPNFCNSTAKFDLDTLKDIMNSLNLYWPDIDGQEKENWLWKHEWLKHGTCAAELDTLDNELKYFSQGINWREKYLISNILGNSNIHPDSNNAVMTLQLALLKVLGKNPSIHCFYESKTDISYLAEIRICFNKTLDLTDCDGVKLGDAIPINYPGGTVITNCPIAKPVHYPSLVPPISKSNLKPWKFPIVNMYKLLQFIMWFTF